MNAQTFAGDAINQAIALKPNSTATVQKLKADLLTLLVTIPRPSGVALDWVQHDQSSTVVSSVELSRLCHPAHFATY